MCHRACLELPVPDREAQNSATDASRLGFLAAKLSRSCHTAWQTCDQQPGRAQARSQSAFLTADRAAPWRLASSSSAARGEGEESAASAPSRSSSCTASWATSWLRPSRRAELSTRATHSRLRGAHQLRCWSQGQGCGVWGVGCAGWVTAGLVVPGPGWRGQLPRLLDPAWGSGSDQGRQGRCCLVAGECAWWTAQACADQIAAVGSTQRWCAGA